LEKGKLYFGEIFNLFIPKGINYDPDPSGILTIDGEKLFCKSFL
jgi:hypothetical protein